MTKKEVYILIRKFDMEVEECFIDYSESFLKNNNLLFYLLGKKLISKELVNKCVKVLKTSTLTDIFYICGIECWKMQRWILAEITADFDVLEKRLIKKLHEYELNTHIDDSLIEYLKNEKEIN